MSGKKYSVRYTPEARDDLDDIYSYIAFSLQERQIAIRLTRKIRTEIQGLSQFPESHAVVDFAPWNEMNIRRMTGGNYNVYCFADTDAGSVTVVRIFYGGRDIEHIVSNEA